MTSYEAAIPYKERLWVQIFKEGSSEPSYLITSDLMRVTYFLYKVEKGKPIKTKYKSKDPTELEKYAR